MDLSLKSGREKIGVSTMAKKSKFSDEEIGRAVRFLINGKSIPEVSKEIGRRQDNLRKKLLESTRAISMALNDTKHGTRQSLESVIEYLNENNMAHTVYESHGYIAIYEDQSFTKIGNIPYRYFYDTGDWQGTSPTNTTMYRSKNIQQWHEKYFMRFSKEKKTAAPVKAAPISIETTTPKVQTQKKPEQKEKGFIRRFFKKKNVGTRSDHEPCNKCGAAAGDRCKHSVSVT
jgi:hypothetical protein